VGPSGAGKSSLLSALAGLHPTTAGSVYFDGRDVREGYGELRHRIGFVPQDDIVHPDLTVEQSIEYAAELRFAPDVRASERKERVAEVMDELELSHRRDVPVRLLSGGERKRVSVALELLTKPTLLFLDEPTSGLDPGLERNLTELFRRLADGGRIVVTVTHSVDSVRLCDRLLFLAPGGRLAYFAPPQLAPSYFGRADFQEIFRDLSEGDPETWRRHFLDSSLSAEYVSRPLARHRTALATSPHPAIAPSSREIGRQRWLSQFLMLSRRNLRVLAADRASLVTLALSAPFLGALALWRLPANELSNLPETQIRVVSQAALVLFVVMLSMTLIGLSNGIREISREGPILRRELAVGLSPSAYLAAKVTVLGIVTTLQAAILVPIALARQGGPDDALLFGSPLLEVVVAAAAAGLASLSIALLVSAVFRTTAAALACLPLLLAFQVLFGSGGVFPDSAKQPVLQQVSYASSTGWGLAAAAATSDLNQLQRTNDLAADVPVLDLEAPQETIAAMYEVSGGSKHFEHDRQTWLTAMGALASIVAAGLAMANFAIRRYRPR
jgi:ABC-type multidrug transport system ATPase subunit